MCGAMCPMTITLANFCLMAFSISYINGILQDTHSINGGANNQYYKPSLVDTLHKWRCHCQYPTNAGGMRGGFYICLGEAEELGHAAESAPRRGYMCARIVRAHRG